MLQRPVRRAVFLLVALTVALAVWGPLAASAAEEAPAKPQRVVILPFTANAPDDISFLVKGVRDMLATRLAWRDRVTVIEPDLVAPVMKRIPGPYNEEKAAKVAQELSAQVVVFGSITKLGSAVSVDARVFQPGMTGPPLTAFVQASEMDQVIPAVNDFAQRINAKIFQRPEAVAALAEKAKPAPAPAKEAADGDDPMAGLPDNMSPLNPLFLKRLTGVESDRHWRSPRIPGKVMALAVADLDKDGRNEMVVATEDNHIRFYRLEAKTFRLLYEYKDGPMGRYMFVDCIDMDGDGRPEVFVSNLNNYSVDSFVLEFDKGVRLKAKGLPWWFRVQPNPLGQGLWLLGQKKTVEDPFDGPIYRMRWDGKTYVPGEPVPHQPKFCHIYNSVQADLNGAGRAMTVMIGPSFNLRVISGQDEQLWMGEDVWGASSKYIEMLPAVSTTNPGWEDAWYYIPTRLVMTNLDGDDRPEILTIKNEDRLGGLADRMRVYYKGTFYSLYWTGISLSEAWRTPEIDGDITDYTIADVGNVGRPALVLSVGQKMGYGMIDKNYSYIIAFTLKPQKSKPKPNKGL